MLALIVLKNSFFKKSYLVCSVFVFHSQKSLQRKFTKIRIGFERASSRLSFILLCKS